MSSATVFLIDGHPYTVCGTCHGSDAPEHNLCPECFGSGNAPVFDPRRYAFARFVAPEVQTASAPTGGAGGGKSTGNKFANKYPGECFNCHGHVEAFAGLCTRDGQRWVVQHTTCPETPAAKPVTAASASAPAKSTGLDLRSLPSGNYGVPGGETRLKVNVNVVEQGKWAGWVFVQDAAEYGQQTRYGAQRPGQMYSGKIEEALRTILADPRAAAAEYGHLTGRCCICNRKLEDEESVRKGIGPICEAKF